MDIAWYLQVAIEHALTILSWYEHLPEEERPPESLWEDDKGLEMWWASVEAKREDGMPTSRGPTDPDDDTDQAPHFMENDQARFLKAAYSS